MKKIISLILVLCTMLSVCTVMTSADSACISAGDANTDGRINLTDASVILKHIAKWSNINIDYNFADTVNDDKINLADVSALLKHIAKWKTVRLGHRDSVTVIEEATCGKDGKSTLTCKVCGSTETVVAAKKSHTYSYGQCTMCGEIDPTAKKNLAEVCNNLATNVPIENGYHTAYDDYGSYRFTVQYVPDQKLFIIMSVVYLPDYGISFYYNGEEVPEATILVAGVAIPSDLSTLEYSYEFAIMDESGKCYAEGSKMMTAKEFCSSDTIDFGNFTSSVYDELPTFEEDDFIYIRSWISNALEHTSTILKDVGVALRLSDLGFIGY